MRRTLLLITLMVMIGGTMATNDKWWKKNAGNTPTPSPLGQTTAGSAGGYKQQTNPTWRPGGNKPPKQQQGPAGPSLNQTMGLAENTNAFAGNLTALGAPAPLTWWQKLRQRLDKLNELGTPTGLGAGTSPTANFNTQYNQPMSLTPALSNISLNQMLGLPDNTNAFISPGVGQSFNQFMGLPQDQNPFRTPPRGELGARMEPPAAGPYTFTPDYGGNWRRKKGGGYSNNYSGWGDSGSGYADRLPAWYLNLNSWNYGE
jgi:hypothetical protein